MTAAEAKKAIARALVIALFLPAVSIYLLARTRLPFPLVAFAQLGYCWHTGVSLCLALLAAARGDE